MQAQPMDTGATPGIELMPTPRVNKGCMAQWVGSTVRLVGKVKAKDSGSGQGKATVTLETSDGGDVVVQTNSLAAYSSTFMEVVGVVNRDMTVTEFSVISLPEEFDVPSYNAMIQFLHQHKEAFF